MRETIHTFADLNVDLSVMRQVGEVVGINGFLWDDIESELHVLVFVEWGVEIEVGDVQCHESGQGH